jgi:hypothetical protein
MLEWLKKNDDGHSEPSMRTPASAAKLLAGMREKEPAAALAELTGWIESGIPKDEGKARSEVLSLIHEAGSAHVAALMARLFGRPPGGRAKGASGRETLTNYLMALTRALYGSARSPLKSPDSSQSLRLIAAGDAARCVHAARILAKLCLLRYLSVPPKLWRLAYLAHDKARKAGCAAIQVRLRASDPSTSSVTQELLKLMMLQASAPEMMDPRQIEAADRVIELAGQDFKLGPRGADHPFCFDASSELPPRRSGGQEPDAESSQYFGAGAALDALDRMHKQLATGKAEDADSLGADIDAHTQASVIRHLLTFWAANCTYAPPARSPATGELRVIHGYAALWQQLSLARSGKRELRLVDDDEGKPSAPETWMLRDTAGSEVGVDSVQHGSEWPRCGDIVGVAMNGNAPYRPALIRSMHARRDGRLHANIQILSRDSIAVELSALFGKGEESAYSQRAAREFAFDRVCAIILSEGSVPPEKPSLLLPAESWKPGRVYETTVNGTTRYLRGVQLLRRGEDYVRATFEWVRLAEGSKEAPPAICAAG